MTRRPALVASLLVGLPLGPAHALSCLAPDPVRSLKEAQAAPERYRVLLGRLDFDEALLPPPVAEAPPPALPDVPARLAGGDVWGGASGDARGGLEVALRPSCAGPWCGWIPSGETWLLFAREEGGALVVDVAPCGGWTFMDPTAAQLDAVRACLSGGACGP